MRSVSLNDECRLSGLQNCMAEGCCGIGVGRHLGDMLDELLYLGLVEDEEILLDEAALTLAALDHPELDEDPFWEVLSDIGEGLIKFEAAQDPAVQADHLARVLAGRFRFTGDRETYDDPANADMMSVIERRRGLPVSLSILYVSAARRLGWMASALDVPGHVLVMIGGPNNSVVIDPFNNGALVSPEHFAAMLGVSPTHHSAVVKEGVGMTNRTVLLRLLRNQAVRAKGAGANDRALELLRRMTVLAPSCSQVWWECAELEMAVGYHGAARESLVSMLEVTRDPDVRNRIQGLL